MFTPWYVTDSDCGQHMRKDGKLYEMIEYIWLDTTEEDIQKGLHEYVIVKTEIDLDDMTDDDVLCGISSYGYTIISLLEAYGDCALDIIAECILEEYIARDANIIDHADSKEEADAKIKKYIKEED